MTLQAPPSELTRHGIKKLCESSSIDKEYKDVNMVFQVLSVDIFDDNNTKKNLKGKVRLSDGASKILAMISDKVYNKILDQGS